MAVAYQLLEVVRVNRIMQALVDVRTLPGRLAFLNRTAITPALDAEIYARFIGYVQIADLVSDDEKAVVYSSDKLQYETVNIPNLKHGRPMTQAMLNQLATIDANGGLNGDMGIFSSYENRQVNYLLTGIRQRMEALIIAMWLDAYNYDRFGIKITNATWGMPADLKVTTAIPWDTAATATPLNDILTLKRTAAVRYGENYNRITMSTAAFIYMTSTTEFQNKVKWVLPPSVPASVMPLQNTDQMRRLAESYLGMQIELYDERYWSQDGTGAFTSAPFMPIAQVLLSDSNDDNSAEVMDFGNAICTETLVPAVPQTSIIGAFGGPQRGPIAYVTPSTPDLNPPGFTWWGVARGWPRKFRQSATAAMTVGSFSDPIPVTPPY